MNYSNHTLMGEFNRQLLGIQQLGGQTNQQLGLTEITYYDKSLQQQLGGLNDQYRNFQNSVRNGTYGGFVWGGGSSSLLDIPNWENYSDYEIYNNCITRCFSFLRTLFKGEKFSQSPEGVATLDRSFSEIRGYFKFIKQRIFNRYKGITTISYRFRETINQLNNEIDSKI